MTELVRIIGSYLAGALQDYNVRPGFMPDTAEQPLRTYAVYIFPQSIENGRTEITFSVHVPPDLGGIGCVSEAERISELLKSADCPVKLDDVAVGKTSYNKNSRAFVCTVSAYADKSESKRYYFRAEDFELDRRKIVSCGISSYTVKRHFEIYPVMTIFGGRPTDIIDRENVYDITLPEVPSLFINDLSNSGMFTLTVNGMTFTDCYCVESVEDQTKRSTVTIRGYADISESIDPIEDTPLT